MREKDAWAVALKPQKPVDVPPVPSPESVTIVTSDRAAYMQAYRARLKATAASILGIFAACGFVVSAETSAQAAPFGGSRTASFHSMFRAPMIRPEIAWQRPVAAPRPMVRPGVAPLPRPGMPLARIDAAPFGHFWHRRAPVAVWGTVPWYSDFDAPWYSGYDAPWYGSGTPWYSGPAILSYPGGENPTDVATGRQNSLGIADP